MMGWILPAEMLRKHLGQAADTNHSSDLKMCGISPRIPEMVCFYREDDEKPLDLGEFSIVLS